MSYQIVKVDISDINIEREVRQLINKAFKSNEELAEGVILRSTTIPRSTDPSLYLAAVENQRIVGFNAFIATDFEKGREIFTGYQSCWSATHPDYQGRKIFVNIINEAKIILEGRASFIFGFPNNNSYPIFIHKLKFRGVPIVTTRIPRLPLAEKFFTNKSVIFEKIGYSPQERKLADWKKKSMEITEFSTGCSYAWGKRERRNIGGINFGNILLGGITIAEDVDLNSLVKHLLRQTSGYLQLVSSVNNEYNKFFRGWRPLSGVNPLVIFDLQSNPDDLLNIMYGLADVF